MINSTGSWQQLSINDLNASQSYLFSSFLEIFDENGQIIAGGNSNQTSMQLQFYVFEETTNVALGDMIDFLAVPALSKFTIRLFNWPWASSSTNSALELRILIDPPFERSTTQENSPSTGITTFILSGQHFGAGVEAETEIRVVKVVEIDGKVVGEGVDFWLDSNSSELVVRFLAHFNSSLIYDPGAPLIGHPPECDGH